MAVVSVCLSLTREMRTNALITLKLIQYVPVPWYMLTSTVFTPEGLDIMTLAMFYLISKYLEFFFYSRDLPSSFCPRSFSAIPQWSY